jgi:RNA polymerase sigma-70 factor (ECF subfamily)
MMKKLNSSFSGEETLVLRAQRGDFAAFENLFEGYRKTLTTQAYRKLRNTDDANDAVQETAINAFRSIQSFDAARPILPWFRRICSNCCIDQVRRHRVKTENVEDYSHHLDDPDQDTYADVESEWMSQTILQCLTRLPAHYAEILRWRHVDDLEVSEIARRLDRPEGTVKSWLFRGRSLLRREMEPLLGSAA